MIVPLIWGTTTWKKICCSLAPSMRAASMVSTGTPLTAADSSTIENPIWPQSSTTISSRLLRWNWLCSSQATGSSPRPVQMALSRPICGWPAGRVVVDEVPHDRGTDGADRHRQEDDGLGRLLAPGLEPVGEDGDGEPDDHAHDGHDQHPEQGVVDRLLEALVGQQLGVVLEPDPLRGALVLEAVDDRLDRGIDQEDGDREVGRQDVEERLEPCARPWPAAARRACSAASRARARPRCRSAP